MRELCQYFVCLLSVLLYCVVCLQIQPHYAKIGMHRAARFVWFAGCTSVLRSGRMCYLHTIALCAKALISLMARGARFLKVTPCICTRIIHQHFALFPSKFEHSSIANRDRRHCREGNVLSCGGGWCIRGRPRRKWPSGPACRSSWWQTTFL